MGENEKREKKKSFFSFLGEIPRSPLAFVC